MSNIPKFFLKITLLWLLVNTAFAELVPVDDAELSNLDGQIGIILDEISVEQTEGNIKVDFGIVDNNFILLDEIALSGPNGSGYTLGTIDNPITVEIESNVVNSIRFALPDSAQSADPLFFHLALTTAKDGNVKYRLSGENVYLTTDRRNKSGNLVGTALQSQLTLWSETNDGVLATLDLGLQADRIDITSNEGAVNSQTWLEGKVSLIDLDMGLILGDLDDNHPFEIFAQHNNGINTLTFSLHPSTKNPPHYGHVLVKKIEVGPKLMQPTAGENYTLEMTGVKLMKMQMHFYEGI